MAKPAGAAATPPVAAAPAPIVIPAVTATAANGKEPERSASPTGKKKNRKVDKEHPEFELTYDMMLGIRTSVSQIESKPKRNLKDADMQAVNRMKFPASGGSLTPAHQMRDYKFKDYAPEVFRQIRDRFGINPMEYILSVCGNFEYLEFVSNSKSGQFFFYTHDRKYMIKTISGDECTFLRKILPDYYSHIDKNPNTLLTRFYGMHRVKPHKNKEFHFLIMGSVFYTDKFIHLTFDLKGSTHGRAATEKEKKVRDNCVYKDLDFLRMNQQFKLGMAKADVFKKQLAADAEFLRRLNIMDYSLLLGIHFTDKADEPLPRFTIDLGRLPTTPSSGGAAAAAAAAGGSQPVPIPSKTADGKSSASGTATPTDSKTPAGSVSVSVSHTQSSSISSISSVSSQGSVSGVGTPHSANGTPPLPAGLAPLPALFPSLPSLPGSSAGSSDRKAPPLVLGGHTNADGTIQTETMDDPLATPRGSATGNMFGSSKPDGVLRRQSHYGVPKNHQIVTPALINFKAPDLAALPIPNGAQAGAAPAATANGGAAAGAQAPAPVAAASAVGVNSVGMAAGGAVAGGGATPAVGGGAVAGGGGANGKSAKAPEKQPEPAKPKGVQSVFTAEDGGIRSVDPVTGRPGNQIYYMGIIDILTLYDAKKKIESFAKGLTHDSATISAVSPTLYAARFCKFMGDATK